MTEAAQEKPCLGYRLLEIRAAKSDVEEMLAAYYKKKKALRQEQSTIEWKMTKLKHKKDGAHLLYARLIEMEKLLKKELEEKEKK